MKRAILLFGTAILVLIAVLLLIHSFRREERGPKLVARGKPEAAIVPAKAAEVGTGWSARSDPAAAVREAVEMALRGKKTIPSDFAVIFASSGSDLPAIYEAARAIFKGKTQIYGGTSDSRAVMTDKGFIRAAARGYRQGQPGVGLAVMTVSSERIRFGVGAAEFTAHRSVQEAARTALRRAMARAGRPQGDVPDVVLVTTTIGVEEEVLEGLEQILGKKAVILGGTAGGPELGVFGEDRVYDQGLSLAVVYTDLPLGWVFEAGFDTADANSGIVTKADGQAILEIDHRPALEVYDAWLRGKVKALCRQGADPEVIRDLLILHPIYRKYESAEGYVYFLFSHPWPKDYTWRDLTVMTSTEIKPGERIYLSHGTWETLLNRIATLPRKAKANGGMPVDARPVLGIGYICGGVMGVIPEDEREKMSHLINYENGYAPFIANFTWGEQGHLAGIGNKHGNLSTSFLVIGDDR